MSISPAAPAVGRRRPCNEPGTGEVVIAILSSDGDGTPSAELIATVQAAVNDEDTRPLERSRDGTGCGNH